MNRYKILITSVTALCLFIPTLLFSQVDTAWVRRYNGPASYSNDEVNSLAVDGQGNVYVTGQSTGLNTSLDYATIKYNSNGDTIWVRRYNGPGNGDDMARSLAVDGQGNVYVTGTSICSGTNGDYATIKYNSAGVQQWVQIYNGPGNYFDLATSLAVDGQGNVYITGQSASYESTSDYATIKYNTNGVQQWVQRYDGPVGNYDDWATSLAIDGQGNVYVTGTSCGLDTSFDDYATIKYNTYGVQQWIQRYNEPTAYSSDHANAIAVDGSGNVYVTGSSEGSGTDEDYATIKYNSAGVQQWVARYNGPGIDYHYDYAHSLAVDGQGNVYVTGESRGSGTYQDYATIKYNSAGVQQWVQRYNGPAGTGDDCAYALALDGQSNVYVTGTSGGSGTWLDCATIKYNSAGVQQWIQRYNGLGNNYDEAHSIVVDGQGNVYVTGWSMGIATNGYDYATVKYVQTGAIEENHHPLSANRNTLEVYPNPAKAYFTVRSTPNTQGSMLHIFDVTGKVVKEFRSDVASAPSTLRVTLDGIMNGIYFIKVGNEMVKEKLVVTR